MSSRTFTIALGPNTAADFEKTLEGDHTFDFETGVFQKTKYTQSKFLKNPLSVYEIHTNDSYFLQFKANFMASAYFQNRATLNHSPVNQGIADALSFVEQADKAGFFTETLPAGPKTATFLTQIFSAETVKDEGPFPDMPNLHRITVIFDPSRIETQKIKAFYDWLAPLTEMEIITKYGAAYENLFQFAKEQLGIVSPLLPDEDQDMICTAKTGAVPADKAAATYPPPNDPVLIHTGHSSPAKSDVIYMPLRKTFFVLDQDKPVDPAAFQKTISTMVDDLYEITAGNFAGTCGIHRLESFEEMLTIYFVGMADKTGDETRNLDLSERRAKVVAEEFTRQLLFRHQTEPLKTKGGLAVKYAGVGEQGTEEIDPNFRQTRALVMSSGEPDYKANWRVVPASIIRGAREMQGISLQEQCVGQAQGCQDLLQEALTSVGFICKEVYEDPAGAEACTQGLSNFVWGTNDRKVWRDFPKFATWMWEKGRYQIPVFHSSGQQANTHSLKEAFQTARQLLKTNGAHRGRGWTVLAPNVVNRSATRATIDPSTEEFYTERDGWRGRVPADECTMEDTPHGRDLFHQGNYVATFGKHPITTVQKTGQTYLLFFDERVIVYSPPVHYLQFDADGNTLNFSEVLAQLREEIKNILEQKGFFERDSPRTDWDNETEAMVIHLHLHRPTPENDLVALRLIGTLRSEFKAIKFEFSTHNEDYFSEIPPYMGISIDFVSSKGFPYMVPGTTSHPVDSVDTGKPQGPVRVETPE